MLSLKPRLMLVFFMEDMVLVWDMLVWDIVVLAMLDMDMVLDLMDTQDLDITARDLLMLSLRLMLDIFMVDMDMVWDMPDMVDMVDMDIPIMVDQIHTLSIIIPHLQAKAQKKSVNWLLLFSTQCWVGIVRNE